MASAVRAAAQAFLLAALLFVLVPFCRAQAFVQQAGSGNVTFFAQHIEHNGVILADGTVGRGGHAYNRSLAVEVDYGLTSRLSVTAGLPYVFGKYTDPVDPPKPVSPRDACRCLQGNLQDFGIAARYNVFRSNRLHLTPSISTVIPSHSYVSRGESVAGRGLRETTFAVDANRRLDFLSRNASLSARYAYSVVEKVLDVPLNRSNLALEGDYDVRRNLGLRGIGDYLVRRHLSLSGILLLQRTHGGLRFPGPDGQSEFNTDDRRLERDRLFRENFLRLGGGASFSLGNTQILASVIFHATGTMTHSETIVTVGVSRPFSWRARDYSTSSSKKSSPSAVQ